MPETLVHLLAILAVHYDVLDHQRVHLFHDVVVLLQHFEEPFLALYYVEDMGVLVDFLRCHLGLEHHWVLEGAFLDLLLELLYRVGYYEAGVEESDIVELGQFFGHFLVSDEFLQEERQLQAVTHHLFLSDVIQVNSLRIHSLLQFAIQCAELFVELVHGLGYEALIHELQQGHVDSNLLSLAVQIEGNEDEVVEVPEDTLDFVLQFVHSMIVAHDPHLIVRIQLEMFE